MATVPTLSSPWLRCPDGLQPPRALTRSSLPPGPVWGCQRALTSHCSPSPRRATSGWSLFRLTEQIKRCCYNRLQMGRQHCATHHASTSVVQKVIKRFHLFQLNPLGFFSKNPLNKIFSPLCVCVWGGFFYWLLGLQLFQKTFIFIRITSRTFIPYGKSNLAMESCKLAICTTCSSHAGFDLLD